MAGSVFSEEGEVSPTFPKKRQAGGLSTMLGEHRLRKSATSFIAGSTSGIMSSVFLQPLEVIKTHMQAQDAPDGHSMRGAVKTVLEKDGLRGLWRGTGPACVRVGIGAGLYFAMLGPVLSTLHKSYGLTSASVSGNPLQEKLPPALTASAGAITRLLGSAITCPITVIKTRMEYAAASGLNYSGTVTALVSITRTEGLSGLYSGLLPTLARDAPYSGLYLVLYNRIRCFIRENVSATSVPNLYVNFTSGALAGSSATLLTHPPDVVRTRVQLDKGGHIGMMSAVRQIIQVEGVRGLFTGVVPRIGRRGLHQAFSWTIFEEISSWVNGRL